MRKVIVCLFVCLIIATPFKIVSAGEITSGMSEVRLTAYTNKIFNQISFKDCQPLAFDVFARAYKGYLNLRNAGKLNMGKETITVCDLSRPSTEKRMWIIDLSTRTVLFNTYVAHGQGSGDDYATEFSNNNNSHQTSLGYYVTGETYEGEHGLSLKLDGQDHGFNDAAMDRGIVVHGADYVCEKFIAGNQRLGRSWGCPAVPDELKIPIINTIKDGTCLFIYYPQVKFLASSFWLNRKVTALPENSIYDDLMLPGNKPLTKQHIIEYINNGKVDSVRSYPVN